jgi:hypothetical protein
VKCCAAMAVALMANRKTIVSTTVRIIVRFM